MKFQCRDLNASSVGRVYVGGAQVRLRVVLLSDIFLIGIVRVRVFFPLFFKCYSYFFLYLGGAVGVRERAVFLFVFASG